MNALLSQHLTLSMQTSAWLGHDLGHGKVNVKAKIPDKEECQFQSQDPGHERGSNIKAKI